MLSTTSLHRCLQLLLLTVFTLCTGTLWAAEAARVVFVAGQATVAGSQAGLGQSVGEGQALQTGPDGYLYLETLDKGFFILRPNSTGQIVTYQVDANTPSNTRIKLELSNGVARHISGTAVRAARGNFRFNTPVAAVGVRGTDFTVFATPEVTRITVLSGGVVVSPLAGNCTVSGFGPCEGATSRELFADQTRKIMQVSAGQTPVLLPGNEPGPDSAAPPRPDEPAGSKTSSRTPPGGAATVASGTTLDALKSSQVNQLAAEGGLVAAPVALPPLLPVAPLVATTPVMPIAVLPPVPAVPPPPQLIWGRWQPLLDRTLEVDVAALQGTNELVATNAYYAILRNRAGTWAPPPQPTLGFSLLKSEAVIQADTGRITPAGVENGQLQIDFARASFFTRFDLVDQNQRFVLQNRGEVTPEGRLQGGAQFLRPNNVDVRGALANDNSSAALLFQSRLEDGRLASGTTFWGK